MLYKIFISLILLTSTLFTQNKLSIIAGATYSTGTLDKGTELSSIDGAPKGLGGVLGDFESLIGIKIGFEKKIAGLIGGVSYSQRGFKHSWNYTIINNNVLDSINVDGVLAYNSEGKGDFDMKIDYFTGYILAPISVQSKIDVLIGTEIGYWLTAKEYENSSFSDSDSSNYSIQEKSAVAPGDWYDKTGQWFDYGIVCGAKYKFNSNLSIIGTYYWGKGDAVANIGKTDVFFSNRSLQVYLSYTL